MRKRRWFPILLAGAVVSLALPTHRARAVSGTLAVHIAIGHESLGKAPYRKNGTFRVETSVSNTGRETTSITVWTQRGWSWVSDNPAVSPGIEALKNVPETIWLTPGETYQTSVEMHAAPHARKPLTFRLGFVPHAKRPVSGLAGLGKGWDVTWSNPVTLNR